MKNSVKKIINYIIVNGVCDAYYDMNSLGFNSADIETARNELENIFGGAK